ncbi:Hpt domain-containing protein, partial [Chromobacterium vaccinii]
AKPIQLDRLYAVLDRYLAWPPEASASAEADKVVFSTELLRLAGSSPAARERVRKLMQMLIDTSGPEMTRIQASLEQGLLDAGARQLHAMRGSVGSFGAADLVSLLKSLEKAVKEGRSQNWPSLLRDIELELERVAGAARAWLADNSV